MSAAINRAILLKTRTGPTETVSSGEAYFWLEGSSLKYKDDTQTTYTLSSGVTAEEVQDIVGAFISAGSSKVVVTYSDVGNTLTIDLAQSNIDHDALLNFVANEHIDHTSVSISAGTSLNGGGTIAASRTINHNTFGTASTYGSATEVPVFTTESTGHVSSVTNTAIAIPSTQITDFTESAQDAVGGALTDSASIDFTYTDGSNQITAAVIPGGVNHNNLLNGGGTTHVDHSTVSITAGAGLTGGGDITASRSIAIATTGVTASSYGSASSVATFTVNALGQLTAAASTAISILSAAVTDFAATVRSTVLTGFTVGANSTILATDTVLSAFGKVQGQINALTSNVLSTLLTGISFTDQTGVAATDTLLQGMGKLQGQINVWDELIVTAALNNSSNTTLTNITELTTTVVTGKKYRIEGMILFRSAALTTGITFTMSNATAVGTLSLVADILFAVDGTGATFTGAVTSFGDVVTSTAIPVINTDYIIRFSGIFVCTTGGTIFPQFRSEVNGSQVTVGIGSNMIVREF